MRYNIKIALVFSLALLVSCGGEDSELQNESGNASSGSSSSSSSSSSSGGPNQSNEWQLDFGGDIERGKALWKEKACATCHANGPGQQSVWPLDIRKLVLTPVQDLPAYISEFMPKTNLGSCSGQCAKDTAQLMVDWGLNPSKYLHAGYDVETAECTDDAQLDKPKLIRLTPDETVRSLRDLFEVELPNANILPYDAVEDTFLHAASIADTHAQSYQDLSELVVEQVVAKYDTLVGCRPEYANCAYAFLNRTIDRAFRGPVKQSIKDLIIAAFDKAHKETNLQNGLRVALGAIVQSPYFLYRTEDPVAFDPANPYLEHYFNASRLSYMIAGTIPDTALWNDASKGLLTPEKLKAHGQRLLQKQDSLDYLTHAFLARWFKVERLAEHRDGFNADQLLNRLNTAIGFIRHTAWGEEGGLEALLTAPLSGTFQKGVSNDPNRAGIFTQMGWAVMFSDDGRTKPIARGVFIAENLLCREVPIFDGVVEFPEPIPGLSLRQRLEKHREDPLCASCHELFDPFGLALENFDLYGNVRDSDNGALIDASGTYLTNSGPVTFSDARDMFEQIAQSDEIKRCFTKQWYAYAKRIERPHALSCDKNKSVRALDQGGIENMIISTLDDADIFKGLQ